MSFVALDLVALRWGAPWGLRRRLEVGKRSVDLYLAVGRHPQPGDEIAARDLVGALLEVEVAHDHWQGQPRLQVTGHRCRRDDTELSPL